MASAQAFLRKKFYKCFVDLKKCLPLHSLSKRDSTLVR
jgi:hypothetical protein